MEYATMVTAIRKNRPDLPFPLGNSVFSAAAFNFGPRVTTFEHADYLNKANGVCPSFCTGTFDPTKSGHIVLRQLKLVIEFPPGSFILLPSAALFHGNTAICAGTERESITQYTAGGLFRWVHYGFRSWESVVETESEEFVEKERAKHKERWATAVQQFSTISSLQNDHTPLLS